MAWYQLHSTTLHPFDRKDQQLEFNLVDRLRDSEDLHKGDKTCFHTYSQDLEFSTGFFSRLLYISTNTIQKETSPTSPRVQLFFSKTRERFHHFAIAIRSWLPCACLATRGVIRFSSWSVTDTYMYMLSADLDWIGFRTTQIKREIRGALYPTARWRIHLPSLHTDEFRLTFTPNTAILGPGHTKTSRSSLSFTLER